MKSVISSDVANPKMLADQTFNNILDGIQRSNLNFQLQVSPFSAFISLKKSLVKDENGSYLHPPSQPAFPSQDLANLLSRINELENDLKIQKNNHGNVVKKYEAVSIKFEQESKALKQENKSLTVKLETRTLEKNQLKATVADLNKEKNVLNVALKSVKQDIKAMSKTSEKKLCEYEKKITELNEFKVKKLEEERKERLRKKKELKIEAKKTRNNNNNTSSKDTFEAAVKEEDIADDMDKDNVEIMNDCIVSIEYGSGSCSSSLANDTDLSCAYSKSCALDPVPPISADTTKDEYKDIELEEKTEGFVGPQLPRMMSNKEFKALMDTVFADKYK